MRLPWAAPAALALLASAAAAAAAAHPPGNPAGLGRREQMKRSIQEKYAREEQRRQEEDGIDFEGAPPLDGLSVALAGKSRQPEVVTMKRQLEAIHNAHQRRKEDERKRAEEERTAASIATPREEALPVEASPLELPAPPLETPLELPAKPPAAPVVEAHQIPNAVALPVGTTADKADAEAEATEPALALRTPPRPRKPAEVPWALPAAASRRSSQPESPNWVLDGDSEPLEDKPWVFRGLAKYPAPEQGFHGDLVAHHDLESYSTDWGQEFGPRGPSSACAICKAPEHRMEWWCRHHAADVCDGDEGGALPKVNFGVSVDTAGVSLGAHHHTRSSGVRATLGSLLAVFGGLMIFIST